MERVNKIKALKYFNIFFLVSSSLLLSLPIYAGTLDNLAGRSGPGQTPGNPRTTGNQVVLPQTGGSGRANIQPIVHPGSYATITEYKHDAKVSGMSDEQLKQAWQTQFNPPPPAVTTSQQPDQTRSETSDSRAPAARSYVEESMSEPTHLHPGMYSPDDFEAFANDAGGDVKDRAREFSFYWGMEDFSGDYFDNVRKIEAAHGEHGSWDFAATLLYAQLKIANERSGEFNPYLAYLAMALDHPGVTPDSFNASDWERDISSLAAAGVKGGELDAYLLSRASLLKAKAYDENTYTASHEKQAMERLLGLQVKPSDKSLSYWNLSTVDVMQASPRYARDFTAAFDKQMNHLFLNTPGAFNHTALDIWNGSVHLKAQNSSAYKGSFTNDFDKSINRMFLDTAGSFNKGSLEIWNNSSLAKMEQIGIYSSGFTPSFDKDMNEMFLAVPQAFDSFALNHWNYLAPEKMKKSSAYAEGFSAKFDQEMNEMFLDTAGSFDKVSLNVWNRVAALKMESSSRYAQEFTNVFDKSINQMFLAKSGAFNAYSLDVWNETAAPKMKGSEAYAKGFTNTFDGQMNKLFLDIDGAFSKHSLKVWDEALASKIKFSTTYADSFSDDFKQQMSEMISRELPRAQFNAEERMLAAFQPMNRQYFEENKHRLSPALPGTYEEYMTLVEKQADLTKKVVESFQRVIQTLDANYGKDNNPLRDMLMYGPKHIVLSPRLSNTLAGEAYVKENVLFLNPKSFDSPRDIDWHSAYYGTHEMLHLDYAQHVDPRYSDERFIHHETLQAVASLWALSSDNYNRISFNDDIAYKERDSQDPKRAERAKLAEEFYYRGLSAYFNPLAPVDKAQYKLKLALKTAPEDNHYQLTVRSGNNELTLKHFYFKGVDGRELSSVDKVKIGDMLELDHFIARRKGFEDGKRYELVRITPDPDQLQPRYTAYKYFPHNDNGKAGIFSPDELSSQPVWQFDFDHTGKAYSVFLNSGMEAFRIIENGEMAKVIYNKFAEMRREGNYHLRITDGQNEHLVLAKDIHTEEGLEITPENIAWLVGVGSPVMADERTMDYTLRTLSAFERYSITEIIPKPKTIEEKTTD